MNRLFVYGIFLDRYNRVEFGMSNEHYATVKGYVTVGSQIVSAYKVGEQSLALTGLVVDVDDRFWDSIDRLEASYRREIVTTTDGEQVYMYVDRNSD